jgi:hypothetical protein
MSMRLPRLDPDDMRPIIASMAHIVTRASALFPKSRSHSTSTRGWRLLALVVSALVCGCYQNVFGSEFETCDEVNAEMKHELVALRACSVDADCGLILEGTSCGCTNELVAHKEFDTARFRGLQRRADELKCSTTVTDCSCPATDGFVCTDSVCGWNYVP